MKIVTAGSRYLDIDAYAGIIAYAELLQLQGSEARAVSTATLNESIPTLIRQWPVLLESIYTPSDDDTFTLIDVSDPDHFDSFVNLDRVDRVIDHHPGFETYWNDRIGDGAQIEFVGAACTQVYEHWEKASLLHQITETSARLLVCGILDNTLNFGAKITTDRDHVAYNSLMQYANLPSDWPAQYFSSVEASVISDAATAINKDTKTVSLHSHNHPVRIGQLAAWDASSIVNQRSQYDLAENFELDGSHWFVNIISISEKQSYIFCTNPLIQQWLEPLLGVAFTSNLATADRLWLRKEILQRDIETSLD